MIEPHTTWMAPSPLWREARSAGDVDGLHTPALLRFATDSFMDDFVGLLESEPSRLGELRAVAETWRGPVAPLVPAASTPNFKRRIDRRKQVLTAGGNGLALAKKASPAGDTSKHLKLYQPAHQRFYLVAACLVCRIPGFPDRTLDPARPEVATFVLRRLRAAAHPDDPSSVHAPDECTEYAFVSSHQGTGWRRVNTTPGAGADVVVAGEQELPLSGVAFREDDGRRRRLLIGLVPVGRRDAYVGAPEIADDGSVVASSLPANSDQRPVIPRLFPLQAQSTGPWKSLLHQADRVRNQISTAGASDIYQAKPEDISGLKQATRTQLQTGSWYALLDFAKYLEQQLPTVWDALLGQSAMLNAGEQALVTKLASTKLSAPFIAELVKDTTYTAWDVSASLAAALVAASNSEQALEAVTAPYDRSKRGAGGPADWPTFIFPLADPDPNFNVPLPTEADVTALEDLVAAALPEQPTGPLPAPPNLHQPALDPRGNDWFVIRCVFQRPNCDPLAPPLVSSGTEPFQLAGFFDPDAPARPIRIGLPVDITPAGLRKFDKNTAFMISDALCGQLSRVRDHLTLGDLVLSVLPWPFHKDLPTSGPQGEPCEGSFGMICTLSLPIITLCALILLFVIVLVFDIIFHWIPYFFICFPLPRFGAKEST